MAGQHSPGGQAVARTHGLRLFLGRGPRLAPAAASALLLVACSGPSAPAPPPAPVTLTVGRPQLSQVDPRMGLPVVAGQIANERLTASDAHGRARPLLLDHWTVSADGLVWRLTLREGLRFQDGSEVTTADIVRTIEEGRSNPDGLAVCLQDIAGVTARGERDVDVTLKRRCYYLLDDLMNEVTRADASGKSRLGTGPFSIVSRSPDEVVLQANPYYHAGPPAADRVVLRSYDTLRTGWAEMMRGQVDMLAEVGPDSADFLADQASVDLRTYISAYANVLLLNSARLPFRSSALRRALNLGVDRMALVQQGQKGRGVPATGPTWPNHWARGDARRAVAYDPGHARALIAAERPAAGRATPAPSLPLIEFTCLVPEKFAVIERLALLVQRQLADIDVRMRVESVSVQQLNDRLFAGDFEAILIPFLSGPYAWVPYSMWHSPGPSKRWNFGSYSNAAVDASLDAMREARDDAEFTQALRRFESAFDDDPPAVLLTWNETVQAVSRRFVVPAEADGRDAIHFIGRWSLRQPGGRQP